MVINPEIENVYTGRFTETSATEKPNDAHDIKITSFMKYVVKVTAYEKVGTIYQVSVISNIKSATKLTSLSRFLLLLVKFVDFSFLEKRI